MHPVCLSECNDTSGRFTFNTTSRRVNHIDTRGLPFVAVKLVQARTYPPLQHRLLGHAIGKGVEERVYLAGLDFKVKELSDALEAVRFL